MTSRVRSRRGTSYVVKAVKKSATYPRGDCITIIRHPPGERWRYIF
jgi:hypothetical protein